MTGLDDVHRALHLAHETQYSGIDVLVERLGSVFDREILIKSAANWANETAHSLRPGSSRSAPA